MVAQRLDLDVEPDLLRVGLVIDAPSEALEAAGGVLSPADWLARMAVAVSVSVDGVTAAPTVERSDERLDLVGMHTRTFELVLAVPLDLSAPRQIEVTNGNLLGQGGWYVSTVTLNAAVRHLDSSLVVTPRRGSTVDLSGQWSRSELRRRIRLTVDAPPTPWRTLVGRLDLPALPPADAARRAPIEAWRAGLGTADGLGFAALLSLMIGLAGGAAPADRRRAALPVVVAAAGWACAVGAPPGVGLAALAAVAAASLWRGHPPPAWAAAVVALCAAAPHQDVGWFGFGAGAALGAAVPARWRGAVPAVVALALATVALSAIAG